MDRASRPLPANSTGWTRLMSSHPFAPVGPDGDGDWRARPERSNMTMLRIMTWISLRLGRPAGRVVLHLIAAYFLLFAPDSRSALT